MDSYKLLDIALKLNYNPSSVFIVSDKVFYFVCNNKKYYLKFVNDKIIKIYDLLKYFDTPVLFNIDSIVYKNEVYYLFNSLKENSTNKPKITNMASALKQVHKLTKFNISLTKKEYKNLSNIYKILDTRFQIIEMNMRILETAVQKGDYTWVYLSKYMVILETKKILYNLQTKIHKEVDNNIDLIYGINKGKLSVDDYIDDFLINYSYGYFGFIVSDIAKFYIENDHIDCDWYKIINDWLNIYDVNFYKLYFKFLVLYIYILNINTNNLLTYQSVNKYIQIINKITYFCKCFKSYK